MTGERVTRRLAAILAADVVGYSRLMGRDESGTLARLRESRQLRLEPVISRHGGRLVKLMGDGALIEFPSAVGALGAAIEFQQAMTQANQDQPEDSRIVFRIGLHLGDLIVDGDDLYGDGVNVAARLEPEAPVGGIVISGAVHEAVVGRLKATFQDLGRLALKNIERPIQAFAISWEPADWTMTTAPSPIPAGPGIDHVSTQRPERRLAAIVSLDVAGYSRLMGRNESGTLAALKAARRELIDPRIAAHGGRIAKITGDGLIAEFPSVVDAVRCVVEVQTAVAAHDAVVPDDHRISFRIGVNLGELIVDGDNILGDGVNIAARLQEISAPGGVCLSGRVHDDIRDLLDTAFADGGAQVLKNIARPIQVWHWSPAAPAPADIPLALPDKPSIAVLPFQNMSGDPEQEYFADGMVEDIITALSHFRSLFVISRNSSFTYKGRNVDVKQVGRELGVRYVLEGSVRKAGNRLRITAQLIETDKASHVWAERYDREFADVFAVQDEISSRIAAVIEPELEQHEQRHTPSRPPASLEAWDCVNRGLYLLYKFTKDSIAASRPFFERAIELDPGFSRAYTSLAYTHQLDVLHGYTDDRERSVQEHLRLAKLGVQLDEADSYAHTMLCFAYCRVGQFDLAMAEAHKAADANPHDTWAQGVLARVLDLVGRSREAIPYIERSIALNPRDPHVKFFWAVGAQALINARDYPLAESWARKAIESDPAQARPHLLLAIAVAKMGRVEEARSALDACEAAVPGFASKWASWREYNSESDRQHMRDGLRKAGVM